MRTSALLEEPPGRQYSYTCLKYRFGQTQKVFHTAWQQHLANAGSEEERHRIRVTRLLREEMPGLPPLAKSSSLPDRDYLVPPGVCTRAEYTEDLSNSRPSAPLTELSVIPGAIMWSFPAQDLLCTTSSEAQVSSNGIKSNHSCQELRYYSLVTSYGGAGSSSQRSKSAYHLITQVSTTAVYETRLLLCCFGVGY